MFAGHRVVLGSLGGVVLAAAAITAPTTAAQGISTASSGLGTTWTDRSAQFSGNNWSGVTYGKGIFVAVSASGSTGAGHRIMRSIDGVTWTRSSLAGAEGGSVAYGDDTFVSVAPNGRIYASPDGIQWTLWDFGVGSSNGWQGVTYADGRFLSVAYSGPYPSARSTNGVNWTFAGLPYLAPFSGGWESVVFGDDTFVAVENYNNTSSRVAYATDDSWSIVAAPKTANWNSVTYGAGLFVAVSDDSVMTSPDGRTWTLRTAAEKNNWTSVAYAAGMFVAVSSSGTNRVMTSTDGITWTAQTAPQRGWRSVSYGNGGFVAVGDAGAVMTSGISTGVSPVLDTAIRTADGFTVNVTNYDPAYTWTPTVGAGSVTSGAASGGTLPLTVTGLGSGGGTTLTVTTSRTGFSSGSATATRPAVAPPGAPTGVTGTAGNGQVDVTWSAPGSNGGAAISDYIVEWRESAGPGVWNTFADGTSAVTTSTVTGLTNGTGYDFRVAAVNIAGTGAFSSASPSIDPGQIPPQEPDPVYPPGEPEGVSAVAGELSATVSWLVPITHGSFPVSHYQVVSSPPGGTCLTTALTCEIRGLRPDSAYTFRVRALSGAGWGAWSSPSDAVTPTPTRPPTPTQRIYVTESGRAPADDRRVYITLRTTGIAAGSYVQPWLIRGDSCVATPGVPVIVGADGTVTWSRRAWSTLTVWFTHGDQVSARVDLPGRGVAQAGVC